MVLIIPLAWLQTVSPFVDLIPLNNLADLRLLLVRIDMYLVHDQ